MPARRLRIAYGRIAQETHAFSPVESTMEDFTRRHFIEGAALTGVSALGERGAGVDADR